VPGHAVEVEGLYRRFGARWALIDVSLRLPAGAALRVTGPNGSGKSTLLRVLGTALRPDAGAFRVDGRDAWAERAALRPGIASFGHTLGVWEELSPRANLAAWDRFSGQRSAIDDLLARVGLSACRDQPVRTLSAGQRRRLGLARLLLRQPRLALLDEPTTALDAGGRALLRDVLGSLVADGATLVVATHDAHEVDGVCDVDLRLEEGRVRPR
jgi:heme exporter protein A